MIRAQSALIIAAAGLLIGTPVAAQQNVLTYATYNEALEEMLSLSTGLIGCAGLVRFDADDFTQTQMFPKGFNDLSPPLQRHCVKEQNGQTGATNAGGFTDPYATRTFLPFGTDVWSPAPVAAPDRARNKQRSDTSPLRFEVSKPTGTLVFGLGISDYETDETEFELGQDGRGVQADVAWISAPAPDRRWGLRLFYDSQEADFAASTVISDLSGLSSRSATDVAALVTEANAACRSLGTGSQATDEFGAGAFFQYQLGSQTALSVGASVSRAKTDYNAPQCIFRVGEFPSGDILFLGTIDGAPRVTSVNLNASVSRWMPMANGVIVPRLALQTQYVRHGAYQENETSAPAGTGISTASAERTGTALVYESGETTSVAVELGATMIWPVSGSRGRGSAWLDGALVQTLAAPDQTITARFAGDMRATPSIFTFNSNPADNTYFRLGAGINFQAGRGVVGSVTASTILGHSYQSDHVVAASLTWNF
ncbi:MAG: autotransporter outer membrane beta-barrel domain-containing protein [Pseudomonadota bacterium]